MKEPELEEEALRARAKGRELTIERQSVKGEVRRRASPGRTARPTSVQLADRRSRPVARDARRSIQDGLYRASDGEHVALAVVGPQNPLEFQEVVSTLEKLRPLAEASGGGVRRLARARGRRDRRCRSLVAMHRRRAYAGADYIGIKRAGASELDRRRRRRRSPPASSASALLLGALVWAWRREGGTRG